MYNPVMRWTARTLAVLALGTAPLLAAGSASAEPVAPISSVPPVAAQLVSGTAGQTVTHATPVVTGKMNAVPTTVNKLPTGRVLSQLPVGGGQLPTTQLPLGQSPLG